MFLNLKWGNTPFFIEFYVKNRYYQCKSVINDNK